jgi:hypothetical protein
MSSHRIIRSSLVSGLAVAALSMAAFAAEPAKPAAAPAATVAPTAAAAPAATPAPAAAPAATPAAAPAKATGRSCDEVKAEIDAKIKAKGVKAFTLDVVGKEEVGDAKVVGSCEGGSKKITYKRG